MCKRRSKTQCQRGQCHELFDVPERCFSTKTIECHRLLTLCVGKDQAVFYLLQFVGSLAEGLTVQHDFVVGDFVGASNSANRVSVLRFGGVGSVRSKGYCTKAKGTIVGGVSALQVPEILVAQAERLTMIEEARRMEVIFFIGWGTPLEGGYGA